MIILLLNYLNTTFLNYPISCQSGVVAMCRERATITRNYYSMLRAFLTSGVMSVSAAGSKYAKPAEAAWSPAVLKIAM